MSYDTKDQGRVAAGLKASINNPNVSSDAKEHARERLENMGNVDRDTQIRHGEVTIDDEHQNRVLGGYKSTLSNTQTSPEAKAHAREALAASGIDIDTPMEGTSQDEHLTRVIAGYKAALHNNNVSDAAKQHAREVLAEHGAL